MFLLFVEVKSNGIFFVIWLFFNKEDFFFVLYLYFCNFIFYKLYECLFDFEGYVFGCEGNLSMEFNMLNGEKLLWIMIKLFYCE